MWAAHIRKKNYCMSGFARTVPRYTYQIRCIVLDTYLHPLARVGLQTTVRQQTDECVLMARSIWALDCLSGPFSQGSFFSYALKRERVNQTEETA